MARDVTEAQLQSIGIGSSGIACVVTVVAGVDGRVVETSGHESAFSSVHINNIIVNYKLLTKLLSSEHCYPSCDTVKAQTRLTSYSLAIKEFLTYYYQKGDLWFTINNSMRFTE